MGVAHGFGARWVEAKKNPSPGWVAGFLYRKLCRVIQPLADGQLLRIRKAVQGKIQRASALSYRALGIPNEALLVGTQLSINQALTDFYLSNRLVTMCRTLHLGNGTWGNQTDSMAFPGKSRMTRASRMSL